MLALAALLQVVATAAAPTITVDGTVADAMFVRGRERAGDEIWLSSSDKNGRRLVRVTRTGTSAGAARAVASSAIFVDACPDGRVVYADANGLVDEAGARLIDGRALFTVPDPTALLVGDLCGKAGQGEGELRLPVVDGIAVRGTKGATVLPFAHDARGYSGRVHRGLRPDRGYAEALSLYGPRFFDVDVNGDGASDLVAVREARMVAWARGPQGLSSSPLVDRDLGPMVGAGDEADLRVRLVDVDGDARAEAVVGVTRGAIPERSEAWLIDGPAGKPLSTGKRLWSREGLVAAIGNRGRSLVVAEIDTSLVSLSAVVLTGRIPVKVGLENQEPVAMQAKVDVRAGRMDGALPVVSVDWNGDGVADLLDLGEPGLAALHLGTATGFALDADESWTVPAFVHVVPMPALPGVVLVGAPRGGKTPVAILTRAGSH